MKIFPLQPIFERRMADPVHYVPGPDVSGRRGVAVRQRTGAWTYLDGGLPSDSFDPAHPIFPAHHSRVSESSSLFRSLDDDALYTGGMPSTHRQAQLDSIIIKLTNKCNEACSYCYDFKGEPPAHLTPEEIKSTLTEALTLASSALNVIFHGGEPLLRFRVIKEVVAHAENVAHELGKVVSFTIQTNASIFNDEIVDFLLEHKVTVGISLDGDQEAHDLHRVMKNGSGTYRLFKRSYDRYRDFMRKRCSIMTTVTSSNVSQLPEIVLHIQSLEFSTWDVSMFDPVGRGEALQNLAVDPDAYCASMERIVALIENGDITTVAVTPLLTYLDNILLPVRRHMCLPGNGACGAGSRLLSIEADGSIASCDVVHQQELRLGHISKNTLKHALTSPTANAIRSRISQLPQCGSCTWLAMCGGTCLGHSGLDRINLSECSTTKRLLEFLVFRVRENQPLLDYYGKWRESSALRAKA